MQEKQTTQEKEKTELQKELTKIIDRNRKYAEEYRIQQAKISVAQQLFSVLGLKPNEKEGLLQFDDEKIAEFEGFKLVNEFIKSFGDLILPGYFRNPQSESIFKYDIRKFQRSESEGGESLIPLPEYNSNTAANSKPILFNDYKIQLSNFKLFDNTYLKAVSELDHNSFFTQPQRHIFCDNYSFAIPNLNALLGIKKYVENNLLFEIGAGSGYWAKLLNLLGMDVICFDDFSRQWNLRYFHVHNTKNFKGEEFINSKLFKNAKHLFICWPYADYAFEYLSKFKGEYFYYCGEYRAGCCAGLETFDLLDEKFELIEKINIPQWRGIHDFLGIYKRKPRTT